MYNEQEILFNLIDNILSFTNLSLSNLNFQLTLIERNGEIGSF